MNLLPPFRIAFCGDAEISQTMDIWQAIRQDREKGAQRLVAEFGDRLFAAAALAAAR